MALDLYETEQGQRDLRNHKLGGEQAVSEFAALVRQRLATIAATPLDWETVAPLAMIDQLIIDLEDPVEMLREAEEIRSQAEWERGVAVGRYIEWHVPIGSAPNDDGPPF
jgi:hypothetical protein